MAIVVINWVRIGLDRVTGRRMPDHVMSLPVLLKTLVSGTRNSLLVGGAAGAVGVIVGMIVF